MRKNGRIWVAEEPRHQRVYMNKRPQAPLLARVMTIGGAGLQPAHPAFMRFGGRRTSQHSRSTLPRHAPRTSVVSRGFQCIGWCNPFSGSLARMSGDDAATCLR